MHSLLTHSSKLGVARSRLAPCVTLYNRQLSSTGDEIKSGRPSIAEYYRNKNVFITGGTGFMGKTIVEKFLRSCPDIGQIYLLVRGKDGKDPSQRLEKYFSNPIFDKVKRQDASILKKVTAVGGDNLKSKLGMSDSDRQMLRERVHVVLNAGATVKFAEPIRTACDVHITSQLRALDLAEGMKNLEAFIHMSTMGIALADENRFCPRGLQAVNITTPELLNLVQKSSDAELKVLQAGDLLANHKPFTYSFTKAVLEHEMSARAEKLGMPMAMLRPSWVKPPAVQPLPGWMDEDSMFLLTEIIIAAGNGSLRALNVDPQGSIPVVPADIASNVTIASAWDLIYHPRHEDQWAHIYNIDSNFINTFTIGNIERSCYRVNSKYPAEKKYGPVAKRWIYPSKPVYKLNRFAQMWLPAFLQDMASAAAGKPRRAIDMVKQTNKPVSFLNFFLPTCAKVHGDLTHWMGIIDHMSPADRETYWMDIRDVDWENYTDNMVLGTKKYTLKENIPDLHSICANALKSGQNKEQQSGPQYQIPPHDAFQLS